MSTRVVKLTIINDLVRLHTITYEFRSPDNIKICPNCCIGQHELLQAISYCKDTLQLPLSFELVHKPFRLISTACLTENSPKVDKNKFYAERIGKDKFNSFEASISKWATEKGIPLYVLPIFHDEGPNAAITGPSTAS